MLIVFAELAIERPTGFTRDKPPVAVAWTGSTRPTGKPSKTFTSTRWSVMPGKDSAVIPPRSSHPLQLEGRLGPYAESYSFRNRPYNDCSAARSLFRSRGCKGRSVISSDKVSNKHSKSQRYKPRGRFPWYLSTRRSKPNDSGRDNSFSSRSSAPRIRT